MKKLIIKALANRKRLNRQNKSFIRSEQFIRNLEYWMGTGADINTIVQNHEKALRLMMTKNFIKQFDYELTQIER